MEVQGMAFKFWGGKKRTKGAPKGHGALILPKYNQTYTPTKGSKGVGCRDKLIWSKSSICTFDK